MLPTPTRESQQPDFYFSCENLAKLCANLFFIPLLLRRRIDFFSL